MVSQWSYIKPLCIKVWICLLSCAVLRTHSIPNNEGKTRISVLVFPHFGFHTDAARGFI